ncbi:hypothetical protein McanMca71_005560 [Microsporum canis]
MMRLSPFPPAATILSWALAFSLLGGIITSPVGAHSIRFPLESSIATVEDPHHQSGSGPIEPRLINVDPRHQAPADTIQHWLEERDSSNDDEDTATTTSKNQHSKPTTASGTSTIPSILIPTHTGPIKTDIVTASPTVSLGPLPTAFDTNRSDNTTASCATFFDNFLSNSTFNECVPVSVLLTTSNSFFQNTKSFALITRTLDAACDVSADRCTSLLSYYADMIGRNDACGEDLSRGHPLVIAAKTGFQAYKAMHDATCLKNPETDNYCFAEAISDPDMTANVYIYHLGLGNSLSAGRPKCGKCLAATMQVFRTAARDKKQPVSEVYVSAAKQVNIACGPTFVSTSISSGTRLSSRSQPLSLISIFIGTLAFFLLS